MTGIIYFGGTLYWISGVMVLHGGVPAVVGVLINAALVAYLALFPAVFALVMRRLVIMGGARALMWAPAIWVTTELGRTHLLTGFPWVLLGYSQTEVLPVAQLASLLGVFGVSALVAGVSAAAAVVAVVPARVGHSRYIPAIVVLAVLIAVWVWGSVRIGHSDLTRTGERIRVGSDPG